MNSPEQALQQINRIILGKPQQIRLALSCMLAGGHLLLEDIPGVGKTTLAHVLAATLGLSFQRVQFTADLLPADIIGVSIYERDSQQFKFHPGPVFSQLVLADEINRAPPKTQSALLEAMEERQLTQDGVSHTLPQPFFVIATQNPARQIGTYPLPESQLDRFLMRLSLGYPDPAAERMLLRGTARQELIRELTPVLQPQQLLQLQHRATQVHVADALLDYLQALLHASRHSPQIASGLSPRAGLALLRAAQAYALLERTDAVLPEHVQAVFPAVAGHRLALRGDLPASSSDAAALMRTVAIP
ncbi:MAG: MoxR family ATPase [Chitinivorax sp.]